MRPIKMFSMEGRRGSGRNGSANVFAARGVDGAEDKEGDGDAGENEIVHRPHDTFPRRADLIKNRFLSVKITLRRSLAGTLASLNFFGSAHPLRPRNKLETEFTSTAWG
jgi:hypothetical protein